MSRAWKKPARRSSTQQRARGAGGVDVERVFIGNGVSELIDISLRALLQPGDEVLLPSPDYPLWSAATILNGGSPRYYRCLAENGHLPDPDEIEALIGPRTRALVLINPNNPTGAVYPRALLERSSTSPGGIGCCCSATRSTTRSCTTARLPAAGRMAGDYPA